MELKDFCEICVNLAECEIGNENCRVCATTWVGKGAPLRYSAAKLYLSAAMKKNEDGEKERFRELKQERSVEISISAYRTYTQESIATRIKLLNSIIAYAEAELNSISKEGPA